MSQAYRQMQAAKYAFWADNLDHLKEFIETLEEDSVNLNVFNETGNDGPQKPNVEHTCGSVACIGGWVAVMPHFKKMGIKRDKEDGSPMIKRPKKHGYDTYDNGSSNASEMLFGVKDMFHGRSDKEERGRMADMSDREIALKRIKKRLRNVMKLQDKLLNADE